MKNVISVSVSGLLLVSLSVAGVAADGDVRLIGAVKAGDSRAVLSLLEQKVDVNASVADGMTALHWAVYDDQADMVQVLLAAGANPKATSRSGITFVIRTASSSG